MGDLEQLQESASELQDSIAERLDGAFELLFELLDEFEALLNGGEAPATAA